jgi:hypothetical protein
MYGSLVAGFEIGCITSGWYHGGINIRKSSVGYLKDPKGGLKGGSFDGSPPCELLPSEYVGCPPFGGWWSEPLGIWVGKLVVICIMVGNNVITCY